METGPVFTFAWEAAFLAFGLGAVLAGLDRAFGLPGFSGDTGSGASEAKGSASSMPNTPATSLSASVFVPATVTATVCGTASSISSR